MLSKRVEEQTFIKKGVTYDKQGNRLSCVFCRIHQRFEPGRIVYEDDKFVVFHTIDPATHLHLLVTPRAHIANVRALKGQEGANLVREMKSVGQSVLGGYGPTGRYCFHIPPWNSIDHLHLHAIASPNTMSFYFSQKYPSSTVFGFCKSADDIIQALTENQPLTGKKPVELEEEQQETKKKDD
jgi:diadenosine tetraphosphate (Ap4A) HIT family hydrolase